MTVSVYKIDTFKVSGFPARENRKWYPTDQLTNYPKKLFIYWMNSLVENDVFRRTWLI